MFNEKYRQAVDAHIKALNEAHEREVSALTKSMDILAEQVDYLRNQLAQRPHTFVPSAPPLNPSQQPVMTEGFPPYVSETESELRELFEQGHMDQDELEAALQTFVTGD